MMKLGPQNSLFDFLGSSWKGLKGIEHETQIFGQDTTPICDHFGNVCMNINHSISLILFATQLYLFVAVSIRMQFQ